MFLEDTYEAGREKENDKLILRRQNKGRRNKKHHRKTIGKEVDGMKLHREIRQVSS